MRPVSRLLLFLTTGAVLAAAPPSAEILWDTYGVPHIFAKDFPSLFRAYGWAQMRNHANLLLHEYGESRGRAAEYWGEKYLESDHWLWTNGVPQRAAEWYREQTPEFRKCLDAFAGGINAWAAAHPGDFDPQVKVVLPVTAMDVLAHAQRVVHFGIVFPHTLLERVHNQWENGSNAWALGGAHTVSGKPMLLANPHLTWGGIETYMEAQLTAPGFNLYGAAQVGIPTLRLAFNDYLGWTHTNNPLDNADLYELTVEGNGYRWNGGVRPFEIERRILKVKQEGGGMRAEVLTIRRSVQGPVIAERRGKALALRMAGLDQPGMLDQYWRMGRATNIMQFQAEVSRLQIPSYNILYADRDGHIMHIYNGRVPVRPAGNWDWSWIVPGDTSKTLWTSTYTYDELPKVIDPPGGFLQNANDPPWFDTLPPVLDPNKFPHSMAPLFMQFRAESSLRMMKEARKITFEQFIELKHSTIMEIADHIRDELVAAARASNQEMAHRAADVLESWDRTSNPKSRGSVLFYFFASSGEFVGNYRAQRWD